MMTIVDARTMTVAVQGCAKLRKARSHSRRSDVAVRSDDESASMSSAMLQVHDR